MLKVALTGGIGSGKTTVTHRFAELGVPVLDADCHARQLSQPDGAAFTEILRAFGNGILNDAGELDRARLRQRVFENPGRRETLESILHPRIRAAMHRDAAALTTPYCIFAIPLLIETGQQDTFDWVLVVDAPDDRRIGWLKARNGLDEAAIRAIFAAQASREQRRQTADDVIDNDSTIHALHTRVDALHAQYLALAATSR